MAPPDIALVLFDCDGGIVDSEPLAMRVLLSAIYAEGIVLDRQAGVSRRRYAERRAPRRDP